MPDLDRPPFDRVPAEVFEHPGLVARLRGLLHARGFRPVPAFGRGAHAWVRSPCEQPPGAFRQEHARMDPPPCTTVAESDLDALNTGLLRDTLRAATMARTRAA